jgi:hypothetical protein
MDIIEPALPPDKECYQSILGSIMYITLGTHPDLAYAVSVLGKKAAALQKPHLSMVKRILRYLKKTDSLKLRYHRTENGANQTGIGYFNSDWAGDQEDRHSTSGYVFLLQDGAISWKARKQGMIALSTMEAEYIGACDSEAAKEAVWLRRLIGEMKAEILETGQSSSSPRILLRLDCQAALQLIQNPKFHERTKQIEIKHHYIREVNENGEIDLK